MCEKLLMNLLEMIWKRRKNILKTGTGYRDDHMAGCDKVSLVKIKLYVDWDRFK